VKNIPLRNTSGYSARAAGGCVREQARDAMRMIYRHAVEPEQLGAFLMLMRVKEESASEVAGFVEALRDSLPPPEIPGPVAIDWPAYAGKRRQLPWFLLAALLLGRNGRPVLMHGLTRDDERLYVPAALAALDIEVSTSLPGALQQVQQQGFAYVAIQTLSRLSWELLEMRPLLGLRSPLHTVVRMLNPAGAPLMLQGVFHPNYAPVHQQAAGLLGQAAVLAIKGEGGEVERVPERSCTLFGLRDSGYWQEEWPALLPPDRYVPANFPDLQHFRAVWEGRAADPYGELAVTGTLALVIRALGMETSRDAAHDLAAEWWEQRLETVIPRSVNAS